MNLLFIYIKININHIILENNDKFKIIKCSYDSKQYADAYENSFKYLFTLNKPLLDIISKIVFKYLKTKYKLV